MGEYVLYVSLLFIPIGLSLVYFLRREGLPSKDIYIVVLLALLVIVSFPISMERMGAWFSLVLYLLILGMLVAYLLRNREGAYVEMAAASWRTIRNQPNLIIEPEPEYPLLSSSVTEEEIVELEAQVAVVETETGSEPEPEPEPEPELTRTKEPEGGEEFASSTIPAEIVVKVEPIQDEESQPEPGIEAVTEDELAIQSLPELAESESETLEAEVNAIVLEADNPDVLAEDISETVIVLAALADTNENLESAAPEIIEVIGPDKFEAVASTEPEIAENSLVDDTPTVVTVDATADILEELIIPEPTEAPDAMIEGSESVISELVKAKASEFQENELTVAADIPIETIVMENVLNEELLSPELALSDVPLETNEALSAESSMENQPLKAELADEAESVPIDIITPEALIDEIKASQAVEPLVELVSEENEKCEEDQLLLELPVEEREVSEEAEPLLELPVEEIIVSEDIILGLEPVIEPEPIIEGLEISEEVEPVFESSIKEMEINEEAEAIFEDEALEAESVKMPVEETGPLIEDIGTVEEEIEPVIGELEPIAEDAGPLVVEAGPIIGEMVPVAEVKTFIEEEIVVEEKIVVELTEQLVEEAVITESSRSTVGQEESEEVIAQLYEEDITVPAAVSLPALDINYLIDQGFFYKASDNLKQAVRSFEYAWPVVSEGELKYLLTLELVELYKAGGHYERAEEILGLFLELGDHKSDIIYEINRQLDCIRFLATELNRLGMNGAPWARVPRWIRMELEDALNR